jgi:CspA family cold shock protein
VESLVVKLAEDSMVLEPDAGGVSASRTEAKATTDPSHDAGAEGSDPRNEAAFRERGRVKWFDLDKGYGSLAHPNGPDVFVHHSEVLGSQSGLEPGGEVEYDVGRNDRGPNARGVRLLG